MCNVLIRDRNRAIYLMAVLDDGTPYTVALDATYKGSLLPILVSPSGLNWQIEAGIDGSIKATSTTSTAGISFIPLVSPLGLSFKFFVSDNGSVGTASTGTVLIDVIPRPLDVVMSVWPVSTGIVCTTCSNASVTVGADFSCWCCACNAFVLSDDTNILVALEE